MPFNWLQKNVCNLNDDSVEIPSDYNSTIEKV